MSREHRPSMAATTAGICSWSPSTHSTTAPAMVALMMTWSRLMGPICRSASRACFGASGVSVTSGGTSCARPQLQGAEQLMTNDMCVLLRMHCMVSQGKGDEKACTVVSLSSKHGA